MSGEVRRSFVVAERYEVQDRLGALGDSLVFGARDAIDGRTVAISVQRSQLTGDQVASVRVAQQRFVRESAALDTRARERAVGIIDFGWDDALGVSYLVTCRVDDPILRPSLSEVGSILRRLDDPAPVPAEPPAGETIAELPATIGSYDVIGALGAGGTGRVYLGEHPLIGSRVAIKVLLPEIARSPETVDRFIQEARASSQIASPHIPRYFDFGTTIDGLPYAIMEYFEGETLGVRLRRTGTLSIADTAQIVMQVANALLMAHEAGLVHRDLKPDNILLVNPDSKGSKSAALRAVGSSADLGKAPIEIKVLDFGIAKVVGNRSPNLTLSGSFLGTPYYCAPEQVFGHEVDARTDVYCLGATAFEMLTGAPPFDGPVPVILSSKATEDPPDLARRGVPPRVASTIGRMLAREPRHRAPSMAWVLEQVATWETADELAPVAFAAGSAPHPEPTVVEPTPLGLALGSSDLLVPTAPSQTTLAVEPARRAGTMLRRRAWLAVAITGAAFALGGAIALLGASPRSIASSSSPAGASPTGASPTGASPTGASPNSASPSSATSNSASPNSASPNSASSSTASQTTASPNSPSPKSASSNSASPNSASPNSASATATSPSSASPATGRAGQRRPSKQADKKAVKRAPVTRPATVTKDILIVDPFSSTRSDAR